MADTDTKPMPKSSKSSVPGCHGEGAGLGVASIGQKIWPRQTPGLTRRSTDMLKGVATPVRYLRPARKRRIGVAPQRATQIEGMKVVLRVEASR